MSGEAAACKPPNRTERTKERSAPRNGAHQGTERTMERSAPRNGTERLYGRL
nr:MAG TPA: hypothetical protein [Caudoviricetes sp.]